MLRIPASRGGLRTTSASLLMKPARTGSLLRVSGQLKSQPRLAYNGLVSSRHFSSSPLRQQSDEQGGSTMAEKPSEGSAEQADVSPLPNADKVARDLVEQSKSPQTGYVRSWWLLNVETCLRQERIALGDVLPPENSTLLYDRHIRRSLGAGVNDTHGLIRLIDQNTAGMDALQRRDAYSDLIRELKHMRRNVWPMWMLFIWASAGCYCISYLADQLGYIDGWTRGAVVLAMFVSFLHGGSLPLFLVAGIIWLHRRQFSRPPVCSDMLRTARYFGHCLDTYGEDGEGKRSTPEDVGRYLNLMDLTLARDDSEVAAVLRRIISPEHIGNEWWFRLWSRAAETTKAHTEEQVAETKKLDGQTSATLRDEEASERV